MARLRRQITKRASTLVAHEFAGLVDAIRGIHEQCTAHVCKAINMSLTLRNWLIGAHIHGYELHGTDRAKYGDLLLTKLAQKLTRAGVTNCDRRQLYRYLRFYRVYPQIVGTLSPQFAHLAPAAVTPPRIVDAPSRLFQSTKNVLSKLSYSHLELLVNIDEDARRTFYEHECMHGNWSVRELKRQIGSLYFERSGLSKNPKKLASLVHSGADAAEPRLSVRDPYIFEFLGLKSHEVMGESKLEDALLDRLQSFMLELGQGFCFEARQKRVLIGDTYGFIDLVFYHRILKCHILIELKITEFSHENLGQLNTYVSWYKQNVMTDGDSPPVGLLLCTGKDHAMVEYALAGLSNKLFVSKYQVELPSRKQLQTFLDQEIRKETK